MSYLLTCVSPAAEEDKEYLAWKAEKERQKKEKEALETAQTNAQLNAQRSLEIIRQATPLYVPPRASCLLSGTLARLTCFVSPLFCSTEEVQCKNACQ